MSRQIQDAFVVDAMRTPVGKAPRGMFRSTRPDDLLAHVVRGLLIRYPQLDQHCIGDVIVGCAFPEAEQGLNIARVVALLAGLPDSVPGVTVNRFCASGLQAVSMAADRIRLGEADLMIAAGVESMSLIPMLGHKPAFNPKIFGGDQDAGIAFGMGVTAEKVATRWRISREAQDEFAVESHQRALAAIEVGEFKSEMSPYEVALSALDPASNAIEISRRMVEADEGPRADTTRGALAALRPVFAKNGTVTAGNSSQTSDGAAAVLLAGERGLKLLEATPMARFMGYAVAGVAPELMGIGPLEAIPKVLKLTGVEQDRLDWIELNEAFAAQSLAVIDELRLDRSKVNPLGGAIALGHPLGATGAIRTATLVHALRRHRLRYGMVTMCVGTGMGAAGVFEATG